MNNLNIPITEEYVGRLPELVKISELFTDMLARAARIPNKMNPNKWPENIKIQDLFRKVFGLKQFILSWHVDTFGDAMTFPDSVVFGDDISSALVKASKQKGR